MDFIVKLRSLNSLVLFGYVVVALPLIFAIVTATTFVSSLVQDSDEVVDLSFKATNGSRMLLENITALERNARQYLVVGDKQLLDIYENRLQSLSDILRDLRRLDPADDAAADMDRILALGTEIRQTLSSPEILEEHGLQAEFNELNVVGRRLSGRLRGGVSDHLSGLQERASAVQERLYWQALALIPLALLLAGGFAALVARPLRQLGDAIRRLGEGKMNTPIIIRGPLDLEQLGYRLDWLRRRLNELEREKNDFLSHVSHELKTPLANIREGTDLLADGSVGTVNEQQREVLEILQGNGRSLQKKIENLLNFNAWQNMKSQPQLSECRLPDVFDHALQHHRLAINRLGLNTDIRIQDLRVSADYDKLRVMFDNLVSNAIKFSPTGGTLYVHARRVQSGVQIDIADEGPGIAKAERDRVFEPFYEGRQVQKGPLRGTGIGLAVVKECVRAHRGVIEIREGEYPGAHFHIQLPV